MSITSSELEKYKENISFCDSESEEEFDNMNFKLAKFYIKKYKDKTDMNHEKLKSLNKSLNSLISIIFVINKKIEEKDLLVRNLIDRIENLESSIKEIIGFEIQKYLPKKIKNF
jgi:hypothetical protein